MSRRRHTPEQIIRRLAEARSSWLAGGMTVARRSGTTRTAAGRTTVSRTGGKEEVCRQFAIAESTWARWLSQYGGMKADDAKRLRSSRVRTPG